MGTAGAGGERDSGRRSAALVQVGAAALGLATLLFTPRALAPFRAPPRTVLVVDASASVVRTRAGWADWVAARLAARAEEVRAAGGELALVRCARGVELVLGPGRLDRAAVLGAPWRSGTGAGADDDGTDLAGAVRLAEELLRGRADGTLVLLGDGSATGSDPRPGLRRLARRGTLLEREEPPAPDRPDLALGALRLPRAVEPGAPLAAELELASRGAPLPPGAQVELELRLAGPGGTQSAHLRAPAPGATPRLQRLDLGTAEAGRTEVGVRARLVGPGLDGDAVPENDAAEAVLEVAGKLVVVALSADPLPGSEPASSTERADWEAWCAGLEGLGGLQVVRARPADLASLPGAVDAVVSFDVPLAAGRALGLADFVAGGGGWLATGGDALLAGASVGPGGGGLEGAGAGAGELAPLLRAPGPARRVLFLADGSGSMSGAPFDELAQAVLSAMQVAPPSDAFELDLFTDSIESRHVLGPGGADTTRAARALLDARAPRGATDVLAALREVAGQAEPPQLVLLLTDGRDQPAPEELGPAAAALREALRAAGARLVVVGVGDAQDADSLRALAGDEAPRLAGEGLAAVFREELGLGRWTPRGRHGLSLRDPAGLAPGGLAAALARALAGTELPPLERLQRTRAAPGAEVVLEGAAGPVLALLPLGRGAVAALAGAPVRGLAGEWTARPELLSPLVRALGRGRGPLPELRLGWGPEGPRVHLAGVPPDWPARVRARFADGTALSLAPPAEVPGADPRAWRSASPTRAPAAPPPGRVTLLEEGGPGAGRILGTVPGPGARAAECGPEPTSLWASASPVAAWFEPDPGAQRAETPARRWDRGHPAAPWLLGLGLGCVALAAALGWDRGAGRAPGIGERGR